MEAETDDGGFDASAVKSWLTGLQDEITRWLQESDPPLEMREDGWERPEGGGGRSRAFSGDGIFEKAGVNFSDVSGEQLPPAASARRPELAGRPFRAMGVSLVFHPRNPHVPTTHMNVRSFVAWDPDGKRPAVWWFGGGFDLTPFYPVREDVVSWHQAARAACDPFGSELYPEFKEWCDRYFSIRHRGETRGVGGLFFDDFNRLGFARSFAFARSVGRAFLEAYAPIVERRRETPYGEREREFQLYRRGRYVEFNLVYDRGTLFGLQSGGRTESILMSLPPLVRWEYDWTPEPGSPEAVLYEDYLRPRDWLG